MNSQKLHLGYVGLSKASWRTKKIEGVMAKALAGLSKLDAQISHLDGLTATEDEAIEAAATMSRRRLPPQTCRFELWPRSLCMHGPAHMTGKF